MKSGRDKSILTRKPLQSKCCLARKMGYSKCALIRKPPVTLNYNNQTREYEIKLRKPVNFTFKVAIEGKSFKTLLNDKLIRGSDPKTDILELFKVYPQLTVYVAQEAGEAELVAEAFAKALTAEHKININVKPVRR